MQNKSTIVFVRPLIIVAVSLLAGCSKPSAQDKTVSTETDASPQAAPVSTEIDASPQTSTSAASKKRFEDMTAIEVAQDPAAYGFEKGGSMRTDPTEAGLREGMKPSRDDQWTKKTQYGKLYILTIHYEDDKLVSAKWGGF